MNRRAVLAIVALVLAAGGAVWFARRPRGPAYYTGFVEGEERVLRSEVTGRVLEVPYAEGAAVPADGIVARPDEQGIQARLASKPHELRVTETKYTIRAPATPTVVQTQFIWPGELAQPGAAIVSVLDPTDKYVQVYVPVPEVGSFHVGRRVEIELDSGPGQRVPGEVEFVADKATFTPEKIETRSDRLGQVYRAKVRVLQDVERLPPGQEGNVYLLRDGTGPP